MRRQDTVGTNRLVLMLVLKIHQFYPKLLKRPSPPRATSQGSPLPQVERVNLAQQERFLSPGVIVYSHWSGFSTQLLSILNVSQGGCVYTEQ